MQFLAARTLCALSSCGGPPGPAQRPPAPAPRRSSIAVAMRAAMSGGGVPVLGAHGTAALLADPAGGLMAHHLIDDPVARLAGSGWSLVGSDGAGRVIPAAPAMRPTWSVLSPDTVRAPPVCGETATDGERSRAASASGSVLRTRTRRPGPGDEVGHAGVGEQPAPADDDQVASGQGQLVQQVGGDEHRPAVGGQVPQRDRTQPMPSGSRPFGGSSRMTVAGSPSRRWRCPGAGPCRASSDRPAGPPPRPIRERAIPHPGRGVLAVGPAVDGRRPAGGASRPRMRRMVVDFPARGAQEARHLPGRTTKLKSSTATLPP
jgi:hypothetical protein